MSKQMKDTTKSDDIFHPSTTYTNSFDNQLDNDQYSISSHLSGSLKTENNQKYNDILNLQKTAGNQAVQQLIRSGRLQPKLKISYPYDPYEQEADRVAEQIVKDDFFITVSSRSTSNVDSNLKINRKCGDCKRKQELKDEEERELKINRKNINGYENTNFSSANLSLVNSSLNESGKPLDKQTRDYMEPRFGYDFSKVRLHTNSESASRSAESLNALAYTVNNDIVFGKGQYNPDTIKGMRLLTHELAHVIQQNENNPGKVQLAPPTNPDDKSISEQSEMESATPPTSEQSEMDTLLSLDISPENAKQIIFARSVLSRVGDLNDEEQSRLELIVGGTYIYEMIKERNKKSEILQDKLQWMTYYKNSAAIVESGKQLEHGVPLSEEMMQSSTDEISAIEKEIEELNQGISAILDSIGIKHEGELLFMFEVEFPKKWISRAKDIAFGILNQDADLVREEQSRYPANMSTIDTEELRNADKELGRLYSIFSSLNGQIPYHDKTTNPDIALYDARDEAWTDYDNLFKELSARFPIFLIPSYEPGSLFKLNDEEIGKLTGKWTDEILENIKETADNIYHDDIKVWDLHPRVGIMTWDSLGLDKDSVLGQVMDTYISNKKSDAKKLSIARTVFETAVTIIATVVTLPAGGWGGAVAGIAFGIPHVVEGIMSYQRESAAGLVSMDPERADISMLDPEIGPIILDVVFVIADIHSLYALGRALGPAARLLKTTGNIDEFAVETRRLADELGINPMIAEQVTNAAGRRMRVELLETESILRLNPKFAKTLADNPMGADLLTLCNSFCFPRWAKKTGVNVDEQVKKLDDLVKTAKDENISLNKDALKKYFHKTKNIEDLDKAIRELDFELKHRILNPTNVPIDLDPDLVVKEGMGITRKVKSRIPGEIIGGEELKYINGDYIRNLVEEGTKTKLVVLGPKRKFVKLGSGFIQIPLPKQIADRIKFRLKDVGGMVESEQQMRRMIWEEIHNDDDLFQAFVEISKASERAESAARMARGRAALVGPGQGKGGRKVFEIEHGWEVKDGGNIYNLDELSIITPQLHIEYGRRIK